MAGERREHLFDSMSIDIGGEETISVSEASEFLNSPFEIIRHPIRVLGIARGFAKALSEPDEIIKRSIAEDHEIIDRSRLVIERDSMMTEFQTGGLDSGKVPKAATKPPVREEELPDSSF